MSSDSKVLGVSVAMACAAMYTWVFSPRAFAKLSDTRTAAAAPQMPEPVLALLAPSPLMVLQQQPAMPEYL